MTLETFRDGSWIRTGEERLRSHANVLPVCTKIQAGEIKPGSGELMKVIFDKVAFRRMGF